ncbi:MAG TPA: type I methionyl aminopeptidase [Candidatus Onthousia faecipullorum]|uniref:Methionine aminopeptidase n=1 Tax=Candidatus Onthousia faecipullorum TaxID=2840887 RepID=A0A9D1GBA4_9FIRM|nr:type I methionyl aminopeptidase [Candidatus Onthousia faecipullorum]
MITLKSKREIELLKEAGHIVYLTHQYLRPHIKAGIKTKELDSLAEKFIRSKGATPSFKGYEGFPSTLCISINDEVVHGFPSERVLKEGDIISIDIGACYKGYHGDSAWTYTVGEASDDAKYLLEHTEKALYEGIKQAKVGNRIGDISYAVEKYATEHNLGVVKELVGHGVGTSVHESPDVPNYGTKGTGPKIRDGMVIAIEPMLTLGSPDIYVEDNDWTIKTEDSSLSAHFEHTIAITNEGVIILTGE